MRPHSNLFAHYPLVHLAVAFSAGICSAHFYPFRLIVAAGILCTALTFQLFIKQRLTLAALALLSAMFFAGIVLTDLEQRADKTRALRDVIEQSDGASLTLTGWLDAPPEFARDRLYLSLHVQNVTGRVSLLAPLRDAA